MAAERNVMRANEGAVDLDVAQAQMEEVPIRALDDSSSRWHRKGAYPTRKLIGAEPIRRSWKRWKRKSCDGKTLL